MEATSFVLERGVWLNKVGGVPPEQSLRLGALVDRVVPASGQADVLGAESAESAVKRDGKSLGIVGTAKEAVVGGEAVVCMGAAAAGQAGGEGGHASVGDGGHGEWRWANVRTVAEVSPGGGSFISAMAEARSREERWETSRMMARVLGEVPRIGEISITVGVVAHYRDGGRAGENSVGNMGRGDGRVMDLREFLGCLRVVAAAGGRGAVRGYRQMGRQELGGRVNLTARAAMPL